MLAEPQKGIIPEMTSEVIRNTSITHYPGKKYKKQRISFLPKNVVLITSYLFYYLKM